MSRPKSGLMLNDPKSAMMAGHQWGAPTTVGRKQKQTVMTNY